MPLIQVATGSSPLTRGKPECQRPVHEDARLIPAHAGKTQVARPIRGLRWAHPRSRGENGSTTALGVTPEGSSPLTRGKRARLAHARPLGRLIPAHAGKTRESLPQPRRARAHPRSRGENERSRPLTRAGPGSSPLTRGKRELGGVLRLDCGLIPAHAGKTRRWRPATRPTRAHPRSRGENRAGGRNPVVETGSSPLTRGKRVLGQGHALSDGLIPAHAGKTRRPAPPAPNLRAHPRSRGENRSSCIAT